MNIQKLLEWRYATKVFDVDKHVSEEDINGILREASTAATSYGLQPFKFVVIGDQKIKNSLVEHSFGQRHVADNSYLIVLAARTDVNTDYITEYIERIEQARGLESGSIDNFGNMMIDDLTNRTEEERLVWAQKQAYIALGTLMIAATAREIDGCPMEGFNPEAYNKVLGLTDRNLYATVIFPIGYRSKSDETQNYVKVRKALDDMVVRM